MTYTLRNASIILQLLAAHPPIAQAPVRWRVDDRETIFPDIEYGHPAAAGTADLFASALGVEVETREVAGRPMYGVTGYYAGVEIIVYAFGPTDAERGDSS